MRIISGKFKNKKLCFPKNLKTRPLKDSVRENIFNILEHSNTTEIKIKNSFIIDLYAGSGSFGLECLSRGTSRVFFVENDLYALKNLKKNIEDLNVTHEAIIYSQDVNSQNALLELSGNAEFVKYHTLGNNFGSTVPMHIASNSNSMFIYNINNKKR